MRKGTFFREVVNRRTRAACLDGVRAHLEQALSQGRQESPGRQRGTADVLQLPQGAVDTTNVNERLNEEFRRRVKTQGSLPTKASVLTLLFGLVVSGQIKLRKLDGFARLAAVIPRADAFGGVERGIRGRVSYCLAHQDRS
jgi:hypothetical protein